MMVSREHHEAEQEKSPSKEHTLPKLASCFSPGGGEAWQGRALQCGHVLAPELQGDYTDDTPTS